MQELLYFDIGDIASIKQPKHYIGVDTYDKDALAYCLCRKIDDKTDIYWLKPCETKRNLIRK